MYWLLLIIGFGFLLAISLVVASRHTQWPEHVRTAADIVAAVTIAICFGWGVHDVTLHAAGLQVTIRAWLLSMCGGLLLGPFLGIPMSNRYRRKAGKQ